jgi:hypothetical protein
MDRNNLVKGIKKSVFAEGSKNEGARVLAFSCGATF